MRTPVVVRRDVDTLEIFDKWGYSQSKFCARRAVQSAKKKAHIPGSGR